MGQKALRTYRVQCKISEREIVYGRLVLKIRAQSYTATNATAAEK